MKMSLVSIRTLRATTAALLVALANCTLGYSQASGEVRNQGLPITKEEFQRQMERPEIRENSNRYIQEVYRRKIAFLPTREFKESLRNKVSEGILNALSKNVATYLQVSEFDCRNYASKATDGKVFAQQVLDRVKDLTLEPSLEDGSTNLLFRRGVGSLGPIYGLEKIDTPHVYIVVTGHLIKESGKERVEVLLAYVDAGFITTTPIKSNTWPIKRNSFRPEVARKIADWVASSLRSAITQTN